MTYLLDTDFVADWLNNQSYAIALFPRLLPAGVAMSIITHTEILEGILGGRSPHASERVFLALLQAVRVLSVTRRVSRRHAQLRIELRRNRRQVNERALGLLIAATALAHQLTLVTNNTRDYQDIPGLKLLEPPTM